MERETATKFDLDAAFKALDDIAIPDMSGQTRFTPNRVNLRERLQAKHAHEVLVEDYFDVSADEDLTEAQEQREAEVAKAKLARIEKIVDLDAESEEDILPSYVGKIIMQCPQCMTLFYKNEEDIEKSEETPDVVNINEICQHCGNSSGYTLVGKVGGVDEDEAANFDVEGEELEGTEDELNLDFPEEGTEEIDAEGTGDGAEEMSEEDFDFDLDLEEEPAEEEEEETNESLHNSKILADMEKKDELKSDIESEHLTLNENIESEEVAEDLADWYRKKFDKPASTKTQQYWEDELNGEMGEISDSRRKHLERKFAQQRDWEARHEKTAEPKVLDTDGSMENSKPLNAPEDKALALTEEAKDSTVENVKESNDFLTEDAFDSLIQELWAEEQPTEAETRETLASFKENVEPTKESDFDEFDDSFDTQVTDYLKEVYSNVENYKSTGCSTKNKALVVEGIINFKSGKTKATKFVFEHAKNIKDKLVYFGLNESFSADAKAFRMTCRVENTKLISESFRYIYKINESLIKGSIK